jgi:hypothetical protein
VDANQGRASPDTRESGRGGAGLASATPTRNDAVPHETSRGGGRMPKGRIKFGAGSPDDPEWASDPEGVLVRLAEKNNAAYVPNSLHFSHDRRTAWAVIDTVEPEEDSRATKFFQLAQDLDASEITLLIGSERWLELGGPPESAS